VLLETLLKDLAQSDEARLPPLPVLFRQLVARELITPEQYTELNMMRELRNRVIHGRGADAPSERLSEAAAWLRDLTRTIERNADGG
jgi:hypothetical protein